MYKLCMTEESTKRQHELEMGLLEMMRTTPYDDISVSDLCDRMNIPRKSFYRYFSGKDGALHALLDHTFMQYYTDYDTIEHKTINSYRYSVQRFFDFWKDNKPLLDALEGSGLTGVLIERAMAHSINEVNAFRRLIPDASKQVLEYSISFVVCGLLTMVVRWHGSGYDVSAEEMTRMADRLLSRPILPKW